MAWMLTAGNCNLFFLLGGGGNYRDLGRNSRRNWLWTDYTTGGSFNDGWKDKQHSGEKASKAKTKKTMTDA